LDFFSGIWGRISGFLGNIGSGIKNAFSGAFDSVKNIASGAINWVIDKINGVIRGVNNTAGKLPGVPKISEIPRLYTGGQVTRGGFAIVGESGPEAVMLPAGAQVVSNRATQAAIAGGGLGGGSTNVTINVNYNGRGQFTQSDAVDMAKQIKDALRAQGLNFDQLAALRG
jgi:phage-related protein